MLMKVICISNRLSFLQQIKKGDFYFIDRSSIWIDAEGDAYGKVYDLNEKLIGQMLLSHFCSV